eukprot:g2169.t1
MPRSGDRLIEDIDSFLNSEEWQANISLFLDSNCHLFEKPIDEESKEGMFSMEQHKCFRDFQGVVEALLEVQLANMNESIETLFKALDDRQYASKRQENLVRALLSFDDFQSFFDLMFSRALANPSSSSENGSGSDLQQRQLQNQKQNIYDSPSANNGSYSEETDLERALRLSALDTQVAANNSNSVSASPSSPYYHNSSKELGNKPVESEETNLERAIRLSIEEEEKRLRKVSHQCNQNDSSSVNNVVHQQQRQKQKAIRAQLDTKEWELQLTIAQSMIDAKRQNKLSQEEESELLPWAYAIFDLRNMILNRSKNTNANHDKLLREKMHLLQKLRMKVEILVARRMIAENEKLRNEIAERQVSRGGQNVVSSENARRNSIVEAETDLDKLIQRTDELSDEVKVQRKLCNQWIIEEERRMQQANRQNNLGQEEESEILTWAYNTLGTPTNRKHHTSSNLPKHPMLTADTYQQIYFFLKDVLDEQEAQARGNNTDIAKNNLTLHATSNLYSFIVDNCENTMNSSEIEEITSNLVPKILRLLILEGDYSAYRKRVRILAGETEDFVRSLTVATPKKNDKIESKTDKQTDSELQNANTRHDDHNVDLSGSSSSSPFDWIHSSDLTDEEKLTKLEWMRAQALLKLNEKTSNGGKGGEGECRDEVEQHLFLEKRKDRVNALFDDAKKILLDSQNRRRLDRLAAKKTLRKRLLFRRFGFGGSRSKDNTDADGNSSERELAEKKQKEEAQRLAEQLAAMHNSVNSIILEPLPVSPKSSIKGREHNEEKENDDDDEAKRNVSDTIAETEINGDTTVLHDEHVSEEVKILNATSLRLEREAWELEALNQDRGRSGRDDAMKRKMEQRRKQKEKHNQESKDATTTSEETYQIMMDEEKDEEGHTIVPEEFTAMSSGGKQRRKSQIAFQKKLEARRNLVETKRREAAAAALAAISVTMTQDEDNGGNNDNDALEGKTDEENQQQGDGKPDTPTKKKGKREITEEVSANKNKSLPPLKVRGVQSVSQHRFLKPSPPGSKTSSTMAAQMSNMGTELEKITAQAEAERLRLSMALQIEAARQRQSWQTKLRKRRQSISLARQSSGDSVSSPKAKQQKEKTKIQESDAEKLLQETAELRLRLEPESDGKHTTSNNEGNFLRESGGDGGFKRSGNSVVQHDMPEGSSDTNSNGSHNSKATIGGLNLGSLKYFSKMFANLQADNVTSLETSNKNFIDACDSDEDSD